MKKTLRKILSVSRILYFLLEKYLIFVYNALTVNKHKNNIAIIRLDAIGDYILFRNFLSEVKRSKKFANKKITLIGNQAWRDVAEEFDKNVVGEFIWIDHNKIWQDKIYRLKVLCKLSQYQFEYLISPTYSREFLELDTLVHHINATFKVGSSGDYSNISKFQKKISDKFYDKLIPAQSSIIFEFERNREFFQYLLNEQLDTKPSLKINSNHFNFSNYVVLFVGASAKYRRWSIDKFLTLTDLIHQHHHCNIIICGGANDIDPDFRLPEKDYIINIIGKTNLLELVEILSKANFVVSNETSVPHFCVALKTPVFAISNGNHFGRFTPYPSNLSENYFPVYHPFIKKDVENYIQLSNKYGYGSTLNINEIEVQDVYYKIIQSYKLPCSTINDYPIS